MKAVNLSEYQEANKKPDCYALFLRESASPRGKFVEIFGEQEPRDVRSSVA